MGVQPPFIYDKPSTYTFGSPIDRGFNPKAATEASWAPKPERPKSDGPLINFNKHPDSYIVVPYGNLDAKLMNPNTRNRVLRARQIQLFLRTCALLGSLGTLFCIIAINKTSSTAGWLIRVAPAVSLCHTVYAVYHLCRSATGRPPGSTASYMIFAALLDSGLIPFFVLSAWMAHVDYTENAYFWSTLFNNGDISQKIIYGFFLLSCIEGGLMGISLILDIYLAIKFRQIARLPPDMNPLEPNLTSRQHKRNKSELITEKHMSASALAAARRDSAVSGVRRIPFIHTRTDSADSVTLFGTETNTTARNSRVDFRKELDEKNNEKDPWRWSRNSSPDRPNSAVSPSPTSRGAGVGLDFRPERSSGLAKDATPSRPSSWLSYLDYEGVPESPQTTTAAGQPGSPVSRDGASFDRLQHERENWYQGAGTGTGIARGRDSQTLLPPSPARQSQTYLPHNGSQTRLYQTNTNTGGTSKQNLTLSSPQMQPKKRSREPLGMNPPTPTRDRYYQDENIYNTPNRQSGAMDREALVDANGNRPSMGPPGSSRPSSFIGSGGKTRFYGDLRTSISSGQGYTNEVTTQQQQQQPNKQVDEDNVYHQRTKTMQTDNSDYSGNFEVYASDDDDEKPTANIVDVPCTQPQWNGTRQVSNSTGYDLDGAHGYGYGYAGLGTDFEFGKGMGRRRDVSGKIVEEGRASTSESASASPERKAKNGAAGWERFKGL
ncbi:hypothetical protein ABEF91_008151 [Exophiala dermatitidis]